MNDDTITHTLDLLPCGVATMDAAGALVRMNAKLQAWLGPHQGNGEPKERLVDLFTRAGRIYFETHLRPLLEMQGHFSEVAIKLDCYDNTQCDVFVDANAELTDGVLTHAHFCFYRHAHRQSYERELLSQRRKNEHFQALVQSSPHAIVSTDTDMIIQQWNPAAEAMFGYAADEAMGKRLDRLLIPEADWRDVPFDRGRVLDGNILTKDRVRLHKDGTRLHVQRSVAPYPDETNTVAGFVVIYSDIGERKAAERQIETLIQEINHRSKNLLSVVQVIARQTARSHTGPEFLKAFNNRIASLTTNQDILANDTRTQADLRTLAEAQLSHLMGGPIRQVKLSGPDFALNASVSQAVGMAIFELATNSAKYGALSVPQGRVNLTWQIEQGDAPQLVLSWAERAGPSVSPPTRYGFGHQVTGAILESVTSGATTMSYDPKGITWSLTAPLEALTYTTETSNP